ALVLRLAPAVGPDVGDLLLVEVGRERVGRVDRHDAADGEDLLPLYQVAGSVHALRAVPGVVPDEHVELAAVDPAGVVDLLELGPTGVGQVVTEGAHRAGVDADVADLDRRRGHADVGGPADAARGGGNGSSTTGGLTGGLLGLRGVRLACRTGRGRSAARCGGPAGRAVRLGGRRRCPRPA